MLKGTRGLHRFELCESLEARKRLRALREGSGSLVAVQKFVPDAVERDADDDENDDDEKQINFIISDASVDRYGDTIAVDGWDWKAFAKNPVLLFAHDYNSLPIGRVSEPWKTQGNRIKASIETFATKDENPMGPAVKSMLRRGLLNAVSVGFLPREFDFSDDGVNYIAQELLELSVVPVPANANALQTAKSLGLWVPELDTWIAKTLDTKKPGVPFAIAQRAWEQIKPPAVQVRAELPDEPAPEVLELIEAVKANTSATLVLVDELRVERSERKAAAERAAAEVRAAALAERLAKITQ